MLVPIRSVARRCRRFVRVIRGHDLWRSRQVTIPVQRHGSLYGGWTLCPTGIGENSVIYSFGVGEDISFDCAVSHAFGCSVHAFDPTPKSLEWVSRQQLSSGFQFHPYGLAAYDGVANFRPPSDPRHVSYSMIDVPAVPGGAVSFPVRRLKTLLHELGHGAVDILKMDIEGAEYDALDDILRSRIDVRQILVEFHHRFDRTKVKRTRSSIEQLQNAGYFIFDVSPTGEEYSFIR